MGLELVDGIDTDDISNMQVEINVDVEIELPESQVNEVIYMITYIYFFPHLFLTLVALKLFCGAVS